ncbi:ATP-binding protein [Thiohalocapsa marina]|uniref:ATP-binding protein n=2 Tax=Thiohalocapsa marina TaxID=424902 RepID=A0A5M8FMA2_9GAMM|nr:ATP-binding protein [Thiohalocapsa marina]
MSAEELAERGRQEVRQLLAEQRAAAERRLARALATSGIPERFRDKSFGAYQVTTPGQERALIACRDYAHALTGAAVRGDTLLLLGGSGTGKTHLACAILAQALIAGHSGRYCSLAGALRALRDARSSLTERVAFASLSEPPVLVLDDVTTALDAAGRALLFEVLDARYGQLRSTILIGDLGAEALEQALGARILERLCESGASIVTFDWPSYRRRFLASGSPGSAPEARSQI